MAQVDATSMTTTANNSTVNRSSSNTISGKGLDNVNIVKLLSTLVYISDSINREINDASFNNKTDIIKEIPVLVLSGYDVVGMIEFLCCKGYVIRILTATKEPSKNTDNTLMIYMPNTYTSQRMDINFGNYNVNYYLVIDWNYNQDGINHDGYNPSTYTIDFATSSL